MGSGCTCVLLLLLSALLLGQLRALLEEDAGGPAEDRDPGKAILEMLHINKLSAPHRTKPHPYMKQVYLFLDSQEARDLAGSDGTLVQSFRSIQGWKYGTPGWIWFNVSLLKPSMAVAELVLLRKTLHPEPLSVSVAVHSIFPQAGNLTVSEPLEEKLLTLDKLPPSGYDVFNVSSVLARRADGGAVGFQLRYTDESGSLVLHEALTQSLYCLNSSSPSEPLLVVYQVELSRLHTAPRGLERRQRQHCSAGRKRHLPPEPPSARREPQCRLHQRYVNFHTGYLADWILEPAGFNSSFCRGTCSLGNATGSTKGARLKDRHSRNLSGNGTDCFPQERSSLTVMYRSDTDDIIIEKLKNMRVESCVCRKNDPQ
ncbi:hypothetical protein MATL_G00196110 [Megalops atlanticus]|uniref:TGF-beta family profile domain-containing protein n=1 Tax=Megalops atlanticus TaxID=7932 RepID=A0A9D3PJS6_MEGAT|nr:hypothetical protein MATL_G00196110 [Megalops atlanticus]